MHKLIRPHSNFLDTHKKLEDICITKDEDYKEVQEFVKTKIAKNKQLAAKKVIIDFMHIIEKDLPDLTKEDVIRYERYLFKQVKLEILSQSVFQNRLSWLFSFIIHLYQKEIISFSITQEVRTDIKLSLPIVQPRKTNKTGVNLIKDEENEIKKLKAENKNKPVLLEFMHFLESNEYASLKSYKKQILYFFNFITDNQLCIQEITNIKDNSLLMNLIKEYENHLSNRVSLENIQKSTAYIRLRGIRLFVSFLNVKQVVSSLYEIPKKFPGKGNRNNTYVPSKDIITLLNTIHTHSTNLYRDLSIFLLLIDLGCRSIEACSITLEDINHYERTVVLTSKKSGTRTLQLSKEVFDVLKDYISIREFYQPNHNHLFVKSDGSPIDSECIRTIIYNNNIRAFNKSLFSPRDLRHTYITNGLENGNSFDQISKAVGHKLWISTFYYLHRSKDLLLKNTLAYSPLEQVERI